MTPRTLFNIILKTFGVFFIKDFLMTIASLLSVILFWMKAGLADEAIWSFVTTLFVLLAYGLISYYLVFKTNAIIDKLKLDQGFDESALSLNIDRPTILSIAFIVTGGLIIANELPDFCSLLFSYFHQNRMVYEQTNPTITNLIVSGVKMIIGIVLLAKQRQIVNLIERQKTK